MTQQGFGAGADCRTTGTSTIGRPGRLGRPSEVPLRPRLSCFVPVEGGRKRVLGEALHGRRTIYCHSDLEDPPRVVCVLGRRS